MKTKKYDETISQFEIGLGKKIKDFTKSELETLRVFKEMESALNGC